MRELELKLLASAAKGELPQVETINLSCKGVEKLAHFELCEKLVSVYLRGNMLKDVDNLQTCRELWKVDISGNHIASLDGVASFKALGYLDLRDNQLTWDEVKKLGQMHILQLYLTGNKKLREGLSPEDYRQRVIKCIPGLWILDGEYICREELEQVASAYPETEGEAAQRNFGAGGWESPAANGEACGRFLLTLAEQPARGRLYDRFRLKHVAQHHTLECWRHNEHVRWEQQGSVNNGAGTEHNGGKSNASGTLQSLPHLHTEQLLKLSAVQQADLATCLSATLEFEIPLRIVEEALSILLAPELDPDMIKALASLPPYGRTVNIFFLQQLEESARDSGDVSMSRLDSMIVKEIWESMPPVSACFASMPGIDDSQPAEQAKLSSRARRATIVLSRSPSFPPLLASSAQASLLNVKMYQKLYPLLQAAGMTSEDLLTEEEQSAGAGAWTSGMTGINKNLKGSANRLPWNTKKVERPYRRFWSEKPAHDIGQVMSKSPPRHYPAGRISSPKPGSPPPSAMPALAKRSGACRESLSQRDSNRMGSMGVPLAGTGAFDNELYDGMGTYEFDEDAEQGYADGAHAYEQFAQAGRPHYFHTDYGDNAAPMSAGIGGDLGGGDEATAADGLTAAYYRVRQPQTGETVIVYANAGEGGDIGDMGKHTREAEDGKTSYPAVMEVMTEAGLLRVALFDGHWAEPFNGSLLLAISDLMWHPQEKCWKHTTALAFEAECARVASKVNGPGAGSGASKGIWGTGAGRKNSVGRLHRVSSHYSKDGVAHSEGTVNFALEEHDVPERHESSTAPGKHLAKSVDVFLSESTWNPHFMIAPPAMVRAQNRVAQKSGRGDGGGWSKIGEPVAAKFVVKHCTGVDATGAGVAEDDSFAPLGSMVGALLQEQMEEAWWKQQQEQDEAAESGDGSRVDDGGRGRAQRPRPKPKTFDKERAWLELQKDMGSLRNKNSGGEASMASSVYGPGGLDMDAIRELVDSRRAQRVRARGQNERQNEGQNEGEGEAPSFFMTGVDITEEEQQQEEDELEEEGQQGQQEQQDTSVGVGRLAAAMSQRGLDPGEVPQDDPTACGSPGYSPGPTPEGLQSAASPGNDTLSQLEHEMATMKSMSRPMLKAGSRHRTWYGMAGRHKYCVAKPGSLPLVDATPTRFYAGEMMSRSAPHLFPDLASAQYTRPHPVRSKNRTNESSSLHNFTPHTKPRCVTAPRYMQVAEHELQESALGGSMTMG
jgi:hypothetical protein